MAASEAETEADLLPFAIDRESSLSSPKQTAFHHDDASIRVLSEMDLDLDMSGALNQLFHLKVLQPFLGLFFKPHKALQGAYHK